MTDIDSAADTVGVQLVGHLVRLEGPMTASDGQWRLHSHAVSHSACLPRRSGVGPKGCELHFRGGRYKI